MQKIILTLLLLITTSVFADNFSDSNKIMNWAEETYPEYFPKEQLTEAWNTVGYKGDQYIARHYASTNSYIGTTNGTVFTYNADKWGSGLGEMGTMESVLAQISSSSSSIVGSYSHGTVSTSEPWVMTFYSNGFYIHYQNGDGTDCVTGVEYGTYTWDSNTGILSISLANNENGSCGPGSNNFSNVKVTDDGLTMTFDEDNETLAFPRVK